MALSVGETVRITGHPPRYGWMDELVGEKGRVAEVRRRDGGSTAAVEGRNDAFGKWRLWFGAGYLEIFEEEEAA